jgi:triosephosphate isomerase
MRKPIVAGNWKMNGTRPEAEALLRALLDGDATSHAAEVVVCPPFTALSTAAQTLAGSGIALGAQNMFWKPKGAYTGQISAQMLIELGVVYVIVGHSETRGRFGVPEPDLAGDALSYFSETDETVNRKLRAALDAGLKPICCVGETLAEREAGKTAEIVAAQTKAALQGVESARLADVVFAYEPVWAIGTGKVCATADAQSVCKTVRDTIASVAGSAAELVRVQYGGSVKPDNARELLSQPDIDGALVGGASLKAADFLAIIAGA